MFNRLVKISNKHSFFLFGPRGTGKSTLLRQHFPEDRHIWFDLLDPQLDRLLSQRPHELEAMIAARRTRADQWVLIDEIQKVPGLLDVVHSLIEKSKIKFALTGSSARKLKRGGANLLAGRAFNYHCHPLTAAELGEAFRLEDVLRWGSLPAIFSLDPEDRIDFLRAYIESYFKEEIVAEQLVRNLKPFRYFLEVAGQSNGKVLNYSTISRDVGVDVTTVQNYFEILEDTLVGHLLPPYHHSIRKRQRQNAKFYYFDLGIQRALRGLLKNEVVEQSYEFGDAFEHFLILEIKRRADYAEPDWRMSYLLTKDNAEIDLVLERPGKKTALIEFKSTASLQSLRDEKLTGFRGLVREFPNSEAFVFSRDPIARKSEGIHFLPWQEGLDKLGL